MTTIPGYVYDHGNWTPLDPADCTFDYTDPVIAWNVTVFRNPWLSLGVHIDHKWPFVEVHLPGVVARIGRQAHWGGERGVRTIRHE